MNVSLTRESTILLFRDKKVMRNGIWVLAALLQGAAIPTFLVFLCCQNVIMRGIVVPVEK